MAKFLVDENLSPLVAAYLRKLGYNAYAVRELHLAGEPDEVILDFAERKGLVIVTADAEFGKFFYERLGQTSMIVLRSRFQTTQAVLNVLEDLHKKKWLGKIPSTKLLLVAGPGILRMRRYGK